MQTLFSFLHRPALCLSLAVACLASGCAVERTQVGSTRAQVIDSYGQPTRTVPLADGTRLQYSRQPMGQSAIMVDLDKADRVVSVRQVLTSENLAHPLSFSTLPAGKAAKATCWSTAGKTPAKTCFSMST
jgi:hypothetical protein